MKRVAIFIVLLLAIPAMATNFEKTIDDKKGDVTDKDIDIVKVWTEKQGDNLVFCMQVDGNIRKSGSYSYSFTAQSGTSTVIIGFATGIAYYQAETSSNYNIQYSIDGNTLRIYVPYSIFSDWQSFDLMAMASNGMNQDFVYEGYYGGENGGGGYEKENDPTKEQPTDKSIYVKITKVRYEYKKVDNGEKWYVHVLIEGETNGVDHVSLNWVTYYKNGTHDWSTWIRGPFEFNPEEIPPIAGVEYEKFYFNSTEGNWNKWKFELEGKFPVTQYEGEWVEKKNEVKEIYVYARAFKDKEETKWNQAYYKTTPKITEEGASFGVTSTTEEKEKSKTPGFEFALLAIAIALIAILRKK